MISSNPPLQLPPISFGGNVFGWTLTEKESFRILDILLDRGFTFIDTADVYGQPLGASEHLIGRWIKQRKCRSQIQLATKAGRTYTTDKDGKKVGGKNNTPAYSSAALQASLKRLQTDYVDLFYIHYDDEKTPLQQVLNHLKSEKESGKILHLGASNYAAIRLEEALILSLAEGLPQFEVLQTEYNLVRRCEFETELAPICQKYKVKTAAYFSLASGFLTGKYRTTESLAHHPRKRYTNQYFTPSGLKILATLDDLVKRYNVSHAVLSLAWLIQNPALDTCLASATKISHIDDFEKALHFQFDAEDYERLNLNQSSKCN